MPIPPRPSPDERLHLSSHSDPKCRSTVEEERLPRRWVTGIVVGAVLVAVLVGYPVERHYLKNRYRDPSFTTPGLAPARDSIAGRTSVGGGVAVALGAGVSTAGEVAAETYLFRLEDSAAGSSSLAPSLACRLHLGVGKEW